jgi:hypothetical protein
VPALIVPCSLIAGNKNKVGTTTYCIFLYFFLCRAAWELSDDSFFVPEALVFGSDDFAADIGIK